MQEEKLFNITIFSWKDWDDIDGDMYQYYGTQWNLEELKEFNYHIVTVNRNWDISIYSADGKSVAREFNLIEIKEFKELLLKS